MRILTVNPGSSSLKLSLLGDGDEILGEAEEDSPEAGLERFLEAQPEPDAVALRLVHGGPRFLGPTLVDERVRAELEPLVELAPLHLPAALRLLDRTRRLLPGRPLVACFDTSFHATLPEPARTFAVPWSWSTGLGIRRYGFHGLSHAYVSRRAPELLGGPAGRLVSCHLGSGASLAAIREGRSEATTMGLTPLDGLVMATRPGSLDPGVLLRVLRHGGLDPDRLEEALDRESGLAGISGVAGGDLRQVLAGAARGEPRCTLAADVYFLRLAQEVAAMGAALEGLDTLVFTGGAGAGSAELRLRCCRRLGFLGVAIDDHLNQAGEGDREITAPGSRVRTLVLRAREELEMARQAREVLGPGGVS